MSLLNIPLADVNDIALKTLLESNPGTNKESLTLDFKSDIQLADDKQKQKLLKSVASFANTAGGDLVIGVAQSGTHYEVAGVPDGFDTDSLQLRISSIVNTGMDPRLSRPVEFKEMTVDGLKVLVVRTHRSYNKPHGVKMHDGYKFFIRLPNGQSTPMDMHQVRTAILGSENLTQQIKAFHADRIGSILSGDTPVQLSNTPKIVLHAIPIGAFDVSHSLDINSVVNARHSISLDPLYNTGSYGRYNIDGYVTYCKGKDEGFNNSYLQIFRNGIIETVDTDLLYNEYDKNVNNGKFIPSSAFEESIAKVLAGILRAQSMLDVDLPVYIILTFLGAEGYIMGINSRLSRRVQTATIDRPILTIPTIELTSFDFGEPFMTLRPLFDMVWQATGFDRSYCYDENGLRSDR